MKRDRLGSSRDEETNMHYADHDMQLRRIQFCNEEREISSLKETKRKRP